MPALTGIQCYQKRAVDVAVPEFPDINYPVRLPELLRNVGEIVHGFASFIICIYTVECYYGKEDSGCQSRGALHRIRVKLLRLMKL